MKIKLYLSPCPNDTFAFHHLLNEYGSLIEVEYLDINELNQVFDLNKKVILKASFASWFKHKNTYQLLNSGSALGQNCAPLLISKPSLKLNQIKKIGIPGSGTTAYLLLKNFLKTEAQFISMRFDEIMPSIKNGDIDAGLIIHESRFTYKKLNLKLQKNLDIWWRKSSENMPLPLGGIFYHKDIPSNFIKDFNSTLQQSIKKAYKNPKKTLDFCSQHATEMDRMTLLSHVNLYVNRQSISLDSRGYQAIEKLETLFKRVNIK